MDKIQEEIAEEFIEKTKALLKYYKYKDLAAGYRGQVLSNSIDVERQMEEYMSIFFCEQNEEKRTVMLDTILCGTLPFAKKIDICLYIFKDDNDEGEYKFSRVKEYLLNIRNLRNAVAHRALIMDGFMNEPIENKFIFRDKFGNKSAKEITKEIFDEFIAEVCYCLDFFYQEINKSKTPA